MDVFRNEAALKKCTVKVDVGSGLMADVDSDKLRQVIWNLARNAVDAAPEQGLLEVRTEPQESWIDIIVKDNGPGIPEETRKRLFDPFFTTKDSGSGLGLPIAHSIIEAHRGKIFVSSVRGKGTEFTIRIPISQAAAETLEPADPELELAPSHLDVLG